MQQLDTSLEKLSALHAAEALDRTQRIIDLHGPRLTGSKSCQRAAVSLATELIPYADRVDLEPFSVYPDSFLSFMKIFAITYFFSSVFVMIGGFWVYIAAIGYSLGLVVALSQFVFYWKLFDPFYKRESGINVVGKLEPQNDVRQQIIISGHHDSANVFNFMVHAQRWYIPRISAGLIIFIAADFLTIGWGIYRLITKTDPGYAKVLQIGLIFGFIFVLQFYFFKSSKISPGAGDNLIASSIAVQLAKIFWASRESRREGLQHTRLIFLSTDAEEAGLRGASAYIRAHKSELRGTPTFTFCLDSLFDVDHLHLVTHDINGAVPLSETMTVECENIASQLGYKITRFPMTFGGGATDAGEFARAGFKAASLLAIPVVFFDYKVVYHTLNDTVDNIQPEAVAACLNIAYNFIQKKDNDVSDQ